MPVMTKAQFGVVDEVTYGTPLTPSRFFEILPGESIREQRGRVESAGLRPGTRVQRNDRFAPYTIGAAGDVSFEVLSKGFGFWLKHMLGGTVASAGPTDLKYTYTATMGDLLGKSFTAQINRPLNPSDTDQPFTYEGGKLTSWELSNAVGGILNLKLSCDFEDMLTATGLATASYPTTAELFTFVGGSVSIGGTGVDVVDATVSCDNMLKTDRVYLRSSALKKEPIEAGWRKIAWKLTPDFVDLTQYNRFRSATAAGALSTIVLTWQAPTLIGTASYPTIVVTIDEARFDAADINIGNTDPLTQGLSGVGMFDGSTSPLTIAYGTADTTA